MTQAKWDETYTDLLALLDRYARLLDMIEAYTANKEGCSYDTTIEIGDKEHRLVVVCRKE